MRKLALVIVALSGLAASAFPVSALADTFTGACTLSGTANLSPPLGPLLKAGAFTFSTDGSSANHCTGKLNGATITNAPASAIATGTGLLGCVAADGKGSGTLNINGVPIGFTLTIVGTGPQVSLVIKGNGGGNATGQASFATDSSAAGDCAAKDAANLTFLIVALAAKLAD